MSKIFEAEFRGLFWGDGNITLMVLARPKSYDVRARFRILARDDNRKMLEAVKDYFGGYITGHRGYKRETSNGQIYLSKPQIAWSAQTRKQAWKILEVLEQGCLFAKKQEELPLVRRFLEITEERQYRYTPEQITELQTLQQQLKSMRVY